MPPKKGGDYHIFDAPNLTALAIKWKSLNSRNRHKEAMAVLEEIIKGSTQMFQRLAQHENFHYTVELSVLTAAAQEKVVKWLLAWHPKKGRLFSWFCLYEDTPVLLGDGSSRTIGELVKEKYSGEVMSWNTERGVFQPKKVIGWSRKPCARSDWRKLRIFEGTGYSRYVYITKDHFVWTQTGWTPVDWLNPRDILYVNKPVFTKDGEAAVIGMYLGDGSVLKNDFRVTHGKNQRFSNDWIVKKFRGSLYVKASENGHKHWNTFTETLMDHAGESVANISYLTKSWPDFVHLQHPKKITPWLCERVTPVSLAFWFMDDGSYAPSNGATVLCTHGFSGDEREMLANMLVTRFGIKAKVHKPGGIYVAAESREAFFRLIGPYILKEFYYKIPGLEIESVDLKMVEDRLVPINHKVIVGESAAGWEVKKVFKPNFRAGESTKKLKWKYDLEVEDNHNFVVGRCKLLVHNSKCAKNAFRSEVNKVSQYRKRHHVTSDSLEVFYGTEDHEAYAKETADEFKSDIDDLTVRWGDAQEIGAIKCILSCILEDDDHDRQAIIRTTCYAYCIDLEIGKFFYNWVMIALREKMYRRVSLRFTEQDLFRHAQSYTPLVDLLHIVSWDQMKKIIAIMGGTRLKIPTIAQMTKLNEDYRIFCEIENSDKDPDSVESIAKSNKRSAKSAQELYEEMCTTLHPNRSGEYSLNDY
jgi:hypothetical protein